LGNQALLGAFYSRLGYLEWASGQFDQSVKTLSKAAELCEAEGNLEDAGFAYAWLEWAYLYIGSYDRVFAVKEKLLRTMNQQFDYHCYVWGLCGTSRACIYRGRWDQAVEEAQKALKVAEESSDNSLIAFAVWTLSMAYSWKGDLGRGVEYGELALQKASTPGDKAWAYRGLGWALCRAGEVNRGIELLRAALELVRASGDISSKIPTTCILGAGYWLGGEVDKARRTLEECLEMAGSCEVRYYNGWAKRLLGEIAQKVNPDQAAIHFEESITVLGEINAENELALTHASYGRLKMPHSQCATALEYLAKALEVFERLGTLLEPERLRDILAEVREADIR
jgi:tetratricopeptide (TPR) repeat protein